MTKNAVERVSGRVRISFLLGLLVLVQACTVARPAAVRPVIGATTIVVVRHAEKSTDDPRDPSISAAGQERARALSAVLKDAGVGAIYATQYKRTSQTAELLARQLGLPIIDRPVNAANSAIYAAGLAREVLAVAAGKTVLIVGHSNTVPQIVQAFSGSTVLPIDDSVYDLIFVIVVAPGSPAKLFNLRFGRPPTPSAIR